MMLAFLVLAGCTASAATKPETVFTKAQMIDSQPKKHKTIPKLHKMLIIAHRGASGEVPEHTMKAYELAKKEGADYIELDIHMTKDGRLIAMHDDTVDRATNGHGEIKDMTFAEIEKLTIGEGLKVPSLERVLDHFGKSINYYIETKKPYEYPGMTRKLLEVLKEHRMLHGNLIIESFSSESLQRIHKIYPDIELVKLGNPKNLDLNEIAKFAGGVGPNSEYLTKAFIQKAHSKGLAVHAWTINDKTTMRKLMNWGVDGFFTNYPDKAIKVRKSR